MLAGTKVPLSETTLHKLYSSKDEYISRANQRLKELMDEGWFLPEYADVVRSGANTVAIP